MDSEYKPIMENLESPKKVIGFCNVCETFHWFNYESGVEDFLCERCGFPFTKGGE